MKRLAALLVTLCMLLSCAPAEEESPQKGFWESVGEWLDHAVEDTANWAGQTWQDAGQWLSGTWGDASVWVEKTWNDSSKWVGDIWGDVSAWAADTYENASGSVNAWWTETFDHVTETADGAWTWVQEEAATLETEWKDALETVGEAVSAQGEEAEKKLRGAFDSLTAKLGLTEEDAGKVWATLEAYAGQKGISTAAAVRLALPYLFQLALEGEKAGSAPAIAIAQYLTAALEKTGVSSEKDAAELAAKLEEALGRGQ